MAADDETRAVTRRQLDRLISYRGRGKVLEILGVGEGMLAGLLDGSLDWPADARERFERAWRMMEQLRSLVEAPDETPESGAPGAPDEVEQGEEVEDLAPGSGGDEKPAAVVTGGEMVHRRQTEAAAAADERVQNLWWSARYLVITRYLRPPGVPRHQRLSAWAVLLRLEIELVKGFESPLPRLWERRVRWDAGRRQREIDLQLNRLRDVKREQEKLYLRRLTRWLLGRDEDRDDLLYQRMLADALTRGLPDPLMLVSAEPNWWQLEQLVSRGP